MSQSVTRATFDDAVLTGDLPTIQAYFAQPHVQEEVQATNDYITETRPTDASRFTLEDGTIPWFCQTKPSNDMHNQLLVIAARRGHSNVLAWLFSYAATAIVGRETMMLLLPLVAQFDRLRPFEKYKRDPLVLETLLTSHVFCDLITDDYEKQRILDETAGICQTRSVIEIAIAHGACVNAALPMLARSCKADCVEMLEAAGAFLVGTEIVSLPCECWEYSRLDRFVHHGIDPRGPEQLMIEAAGKSTTDTTVYFLLDGSYLDVDARDDYGMTALMRVAAVDPPDNLYPPFRNPTPDVARTLLAYCDVNLTDNLGRTALHFGVLGNYEVASLLVANGADPSIRSDAGLAPLDMVNLWPFSVDWSSYIDDGEVELLVQLLEQLLEAGADPYAVPPDGCFDEDTDEDAEEDTLSKASGGTNDRRSLYSRLSASEDGQEFIRTHAQYFERGGVESNATRLPNE